MPVYEIRDSANVLIAEHVRIDIAGGKKLMSWRRPGLSEGLGGYGTENLPLYGTQYLGILSPGRTVLLCEGEAATEALWGWRIPAVGTVTGASGTPGAEALGVLLPFDVVTWEDRDAAGEAHMARCTAWLTGQGASPRRLVWGSEKGDDAADFVARGGTKAELTALVRSAPTWPPPAPPPPPPRPRYERPGAEEERRERARLELVRVVERAWGPPARQDGRSLWWRCQFHQGDRDPSFKVDLKEPYYRCFGCDARGDIFTFRAALSGQTFKEVLLELAPPVIRGVPVWRCGG